VEHQTEAALRERIKELTCLYGIAQVVERTELSLEERIRRIVALLPPAWQYPQWAQARIVIDDRTYATPGFQRSSRSQTSEVRVNGSRRGVVEVVYGDTGADGAAAPPTGTGHPFLPEEQSLLDAVARQLSSIVEREEIEQERIRLSEQLRHADRLATIGQLAAAVAHELNEPLGNILGFAQLARQCPHLPKAAANDTDKIVNAALHAREVVRKLVHFARPAPPQKLHVNLNRIIEDGLYFLQARCAKSGIELVRSLAPDLPTVLADPSQLYQVLVNLVVNAIQALPGGGRLVVQTAASAEHVFLVVEDNGVGMTAEVAERIFTPFFTTKGVGEGTGLGLTVAQGIVESHGGTIGVRSTPGQGSRFEVRLPLAEASGV
jgi:signal transduction histidine kinase